MFSSLPDLQKERGFPHPSRKKKLLQSKRESTPFLSPGSPTNSTEEPKKNSLKMRERSVNAYENKGSDFHSPKRSWNIIENKGCYAL